MFGKQTEIRQDMETMKKIAMITRGKTVKGKK